MASLNWESVGEGFPDSHQNDELLLVITREQSEQENWIISLEQEAIPSLSREIEYLKTFVGFSKSQHKPFVVVRWTAFDTPSLEKRWLLGQLVKKLKTQFESIQKLAIYLAGDEIEPWQLAMAEDTFFSYCDHSYNELKLSSVRAMVKNLGDLRQCDAFAQPRLQYQKGYRQWINEEPDVMTSLEIGRRLQSFAKSHQCDFQEFDRERLKELGMNLLLAVGQASELSPSRLYMVGSNIKPGDRPLMLVGKGITFDTGGINVKPYEGFVNAMKNDMGGAALMSNLFMALVKAGYDKPLALVIPACENLVAERSMKPGAIYKSYKGHSVVVDHTDAEGRLILADALAYGEEQLKPCLTLTAATLTTAALRQFSGYFTPVHFANHQFELSLREQAHRFGENFTFWDSFLPFKWANKGKVSDLTNMGRLPASANIGGGSNIAGHFLKEFVDGPMIHFDIFASTWNWSSDYPGSTFGATGASFNSIFEAIMADSGDLWGYRKP
ncbi:M17 family metallopeptidase [Pseudobacteriovorax antillogorgiicola]|uniref:Cytosol aminopeptidase family, catalytic domain n=1 Tax=Pseudobacteriovorax antillogorgiicola TaxID=1513793 RepID=A0A1Y6BWL9_9BACT|nr:M17 family metallopeptidase [Pseudobacteriovorax antillogorgiicola]TCS50217.1 cytosol aminopeptidase family protein [Pseudobacteriovorax antillogorgiicola]SMF32515.1 Cytosol aminopeptidase family, catalytic domain [Pseudobacteriovorax antillogorgiicola]